MKSVRPVYKLIRIYKARLDMELYSYTSCLKVQLIIVH